MNLGRHYSTRYSHDCSQPSRLQMWSPRMRKAPWKGLEHPQSLVFAGGLGTTVFIEYLLLVSPFAKCRVSSLSPILQTKKPRPGELRGARVTRQVGAELGLNPGLRCAFSFLPFWSCMGAAGSQEPMGCDLQPALCSPGACGAPGPQREELRMDRAARGHE